MYLFVGSLLLTLFDLKHSMKVLLVLSFIQGALVVEILKGLLWRYSFFSMHPEESQASLISYFASYLKLNASLKNKYTLYRFILFTNK